jgi:histidinol-phosphate/aromatic aminotransferase/cobyric acid decarboxylase-like protein
MTPEMRSVKLRKLSETEGYADLDELFEAAASDSVSPAICCNPENPECDYTADMEPDQDRGWCEECRSGTMVSAHVLGGLI